MGAQCTCSATESSELLVEPAEAENIHRKDPSRPKLAEIESFNEDYQLDVGSDAVLGHSSIGTVVKTRHKSSSKVHAVKQISKRNIEGEQWKGEIKAMTELDHPNICKVHDTWEDAMNIYLVMELCRGGQLMGLGGAKDDKVNETTISVLVRQMVGAVAHLHEHNVVHSDIRPENWLFEEELNADKRPVDTQLKMVDFGFSNKYGRARPRRRSSRLEQPPPVVVDKRKRPVNNVKEDRTLFCKAPEQVSNGARSSRLGAGDPLHVEEKADVWALGVLSYFLLSGHAPFGSPDKDKLFRTANFVFMPVDVWRPVSSEAKNFIAMCLRQDPHERLSAQKALSLPWMGLAKRALEEEEELKRIGRWPPMENFKTSAKLSVLDPPLPAAEKIKSSFARMNQLNVLEKAAVIAAAHKLPEGKINDLATAYQEMDKNGEGVITAQEFFDGLESSGVPCKELTTLIRGVDLNGSRMIEYLEFVAAIEDFQRNMQDSAVWAVFKNFDSQGSKSVMKKRLVEALGRNTHRKSIADNFPDLPLEDVLQELDHDGNEVIGFDEFKMILRHSGGKQDKPPPNQDKVKM